MDEEGWRNAGKASEFEEGAPRAIELGDEQACVVRLGGNIYAVGNKCPHYECPLDEGTLLGSELVCKCHDARFDLKTGRMTSPPALKDLPVYPVKVEEGDVWLGPAVKPKRPEVGSGDPRVFLIVGGGAAGNAAAETLRREGFAGRVVIATAEADLPYDRPNLSKEFTSGAAKSEWMPLRSAKFYENQRIEILGSTRVVSLDPNKKTATLESGEVVAFDKALLATGGAPRARTIPGSDGPGCFDLRSFADARAIVAAAASAKKALLIGAGFIGMELASSLRERGLEVELAAPESVPLSRVFGDEVGGFLKARLEGKGVSFRLGQGVAGIAGPLGGKVVELADGSRLTGDFVVFGLGARPVVDYLEGSGLTEGGAVPVDSSLRTRSPDVFAAGDIAAVDAGSAVGTASGVSAGEGSRRIEHWVVAERQGRHAALAMLGRMALYDEVPFFWTRQAGISLKYVGYARDWDETAVRGDIAEGRFVVGYYRKGALVAASSVGMPRDLTAVELLLKKGVGVPRSKLLDPSFDLLAMARTAL